MNVQQIALRLREQMSSFLGNLSRFVPQRTARRFVQEALYGITARKSLRLSEIARSLEEEIALIKTENRLSRQAQRRGLHQGLHDFVLHGSCHRIQHDTLLVIDLSDIVKPFGRKMEHLARVRDGSNGGYGDGYWLCQVVAVECGGTRITPLVNHLWSQNDPEHKSENTEILSCIDQVTRHCASRGIWVMDRGGDRIRIIEELLHKQRRFLIRLVGNRHLLHNGKAALAEELANSCPLPYTEFLTKQKSDGTEERLKLSFGVLTVRLPAFPQKQLRMVVLHGFPGGPIMILTSEPIKNSRRSIQWAIDAYLTRWRIEDTLRFAKQTYAIEDVRVLGYQSLRNMMALTLLAMSFSMHWLGSKDKLAVLAHHAITAAKRLFGIADFRYYAISDGISEILRKRTKPPFPRQDILPGDEQLDILSFSDA